MTRDEKLKLIWRHTHRDYRSSKAGAARHILMFVPGAGTCLVPLCSLTEEQIAAKLPFALKAEEARKTNWGIE